ncbi:MAG: YbaK/EbsC family protein [Acidobacteriota bacterium]
MTDDTLSRSAQRVRDALEQAGVTPAVRELAASTRTAEDAAAAIGCTVAQIAKSLVFEDAESGDLVLVIASGSNFVDLDAVHRATDLRLKKVKGSIVKRRVGFAIGGVPPVGHTERLRTLLDRDLRALDQIWAAAGTPHAVFPLDPDQLEALTGGEWLHLAS